jgi:hypothetical protein
MLGLQSETLRLKTPQKLPHVPTNPSSCLKPQLDDAKAQNDDVRAFTGQRHGARARPPRSKPAKVPLVERPPFSLVQAFDISLPLAGVSASIWWDFSPMEVLANHLPICTFPSGMVLQQQQAHPPWADKSQGS